MNVLILYPLKLPEIFPVFSEGIKWKHWQEMDSWQQTTCTCQLESSCKNTCSKKLGNIPRKYSWKSFFVLKFNLKFPKTPQETIYQQISCQETSLDITDLMGAVNVVEDNSLRGVQKKKCFENLAVDLDHY